MYPMARFPSPTFAHQLAIAVAFTVAVAYPRSLDVNLNPPVISPRAPLDPNLLCFASIPAIAGIGVRLSTYLQSFLLFITTFLFVFDGFVDIGEQKLLEKSYSNMLITACALLFSAIAKAAQHELSIYHALIILDLSWILIANAVVICVIPTIDGQQARWRQWLWSWWPSRAGQIPAILLVSLQFCAMGGLGIYVWSNPNRLLATNPQCTRDMSIYVFASRLSAADPRLRIASIVFYTIASIPIFNAAAFTIIAVGVVNLILMLFPTSYTFGRLYRTTMVVQAIVNVLIIISVELTIHANKSLIDNGESEWGFGQILALLLVLAPLMEVTSVALTMPKVRNRSRMVSTKYWIRRVLRGGDTSWDKIFRRSIQEIDMVLDSLSQKSTLPEALPAQLALRTAKASLEAVNNAVPTPSSQDEEHKDFGGGDTPPPTDLPHLGSLDEKSTSPEAAPSELGLKPTRASLNVPPSSSQTEPRADPSHPEFLPTEPPPPPSRNDDDQPKVLTDTPPPPTPGLAALDGHPLNVDMICDRISQLCESRFPGVRDPKTYRLIRAHLETTREALRTANAALEAYRISEHRCQ